MTPCFPTVGPICRLNATATAAASMQCHVRSNTLLHGIGCLLSQMTCLALPSAVLAPRLATPCTSCLHLTRSSEYARILSNVYPVHWKRLSIHVVFVQREAGWSIRCPIRNFRSLGHTIFNYASTNDHPPARAQLNICLLYTSDAADE